MENERTFGKPRPPVEMCRLCNVELLNEKSSKEHYNGKLHRSTAERLGKRQERAEYGVFMRRYDIPSVPDEELLTLFCQFGHVLHIKRPPPEKKFCIVKFSESEAAQKVISTPILLRGKKLSVFPEKPYGTSYQMKMTTQIQKTIPLEKRNHGNGGFANRKALSTTKNSELISAAELSELTGSFDDMVREFVKLIQAEPGGLESKCEKVCRDLEQTFEHELRGVKARLFGSTITRLAFRESDLDIFMECPEGQPPKNFVAKKSGPMYRSGQFTDIVKIPRARVPIIKCIHKKTGLACDVTFMTKLGVMNSKLMRFLISLDSRLQPIFMVLKYWCRFHDITGIGKFSNYAMCMLIIFYFQQLNNPLLPSVRKLQDCVDEDSREWVEEWECSFSEDRTKVPKCNNNLTIKQLLQGFFEFFSSYDYKLYVISPLYGLKIQKRFLLLNACEDIPARKEMELLPETVKQCIMKIASLQGDNKFKSSSPFCIQDPFDLSYNLTKCVPEPLVTKFIWLCNYTKDVVFKVETKDSDLLKLMFNETAVPLPKVFTKGAFVKEIEMSALVLPNTNEEFRQTEMYKMKWFKSVKDALLLVLEKVYAFIITPKPEILSPRNRKPLDKNEVYKNLNFCCMSKSTVYSGRKSVEKKLILTKQHSIEREIIISEDIVSNDKNTRQICRTQTKLICYPNLSPPKLTITFVNAGNRKYNSFNPYMRWMDCDLINHCQLALKLTVDNELYFDKHSKSTKSKSHGKPLPSCSSESKDDTVRVIVNTADCINTENEDVVSKSIMDIDIPPLEGLSETNMNNQDNIINAINRNNSSSKRYRKKKRKFHSRDGASPDQMGYKGLKGNDGNRFPSSKDECKPYHDPATVLLEAIERPFYVQGWF